MSSPAVSPSAASLPWVHLRMHSEFSITDGIVRIDEAIARAQQQRMPALALTDLMGAFGWLRFYQAARAAGIKPIIGVDGWLENERNPDDPTRILLLARQIEGYRFLCRLLDAAYRGDRRQGRVRIARAALLEASAQERGGLIVLSGAHEGEIGRLLLQGQTDLAERSARAWAEAFPDAFYLELQRSGHVQAEDCVHASLALAARYALPVVATHPIQFLSADDFEAHEARVCIAEGELLADPRRARRYTGAQYFSSAEEMHARFADIPAAIENTLAIAQRCNLTLPLGRPALPVFPTPAGVTPEDYLRADAEHGLKARLLMLYPDAAERSARAAEYHARLGFECDTIVQMGFAGYFLIVADFIDWAKNHDCPVGPGRGSGAGSLVAYALGITALDPLRYALLFERFLNPERVSMPDFDIDFCAENRGRVIDYVRDKYGAEAVSQIATFGAMSSKAVIRDVGRVLELPLGLCDRLSKLIPVEAAKPLPLARALEVEPQIADLVEAEGAEALLTLARKLENLTRNVGMHAGGVLIAPGKLTDFCPLYQAEGTEAVRVSQFDKDDVEAIGLVKFDFLGLGNLTTIALAQDFIARTRGERFDMDTLPLDDAATYEIFRKGNTVGIFQFESDGMRKALMEAKPSVFEHLIAFNALYRPGPMDLIPDFIRRMHGEAYENLHPLLEAVLAPTYGIMVYQEQVMQTAQVCAGYTLGGADLLRRAMGKKKVEEMAQQRAQFVAGAAQKGIAAKKANEIFDYMEKFAGYGFNKSHAAAYALVAYQTAWLKAHYPAEYMAAAMSTMLGNTDQLEVFYDDCRRNGLRLLPPDINQNAYLFEPVDAGTIRYALGAIKGTGEAAVQQLIEARARGPYADLFDFCRRLDKRVVNRRATEALIRAGAFDGIDTHRARLLASLPAAMEEAERAAAHVHQDSLFGGAETDARLDAAPLPLTEVPHWSETEKLSEEKTVLGFFFSSHPFLSHEKEVRQLARVPLAELALPRFERGAAAAPRHEEGDAAPRQRNREPMHKQWIAGIITRLRAKITVRGKMQFLTLDDLSAKRDVLIYAETLALEREKIREDALVLIEAKISEDRFGGEGGLRLVADRVWDIAQLRGHLASQLRGCLQIEWNGNTGVPHGDPAPAVARLHALLEPCRRNEQACPVRIHYRNGLVACDIQLGEPWRVRPHDRLIAELRHWLGEDAVGMVYAPDSPPDRVVIRNERMRHRNPTGLAA